jgi:hypothetical protein
MNTIQTPHTLRLREHEIGPKGRSNGGFACGSLAALVGGTARVDLVAGVPVATDLRVSVGHGRATLTVGDTVLARARAVEPFVLEPPVRPSWDEAADARERHPLRGVRHPLSDCVVCGPERYDGLRVTPGPLAGDPDVLASPFDPTDQFAVDGQVRPAAVWGALDCPSYPATALRERRLSLLASLEAHQVRPLAPGERTVVVGWTTGSGARSVRTASAMIAEDGAVVATARAVWVALRHQWLARAIARFTG